jgi:hypothetical protein
VVLFHLRARPVGRGRTAGGAARGGVPRAEGAGRVMGQLQAMGGVVEAS